MVFEPESNENFLMNFSIPKKLHTAKQYRQHTWIFNVQNRGANIHVSRILQMYSVKRRTNRKLFAENCSGSKLLIIVTSKQSNSRLLRGIVEEQLKSSLNFDSLNRCFRSDTKLRGRPHLNFEHGNFD